MSYRLELIEPSWLQCVGSSACGFAAWALWDGRGNESGAARAGLLAVAAWGAALALGALAALCGAARSSAPLLAAAFSLLALTGVAEAAAAWWGAAHRPELRRALHEALEHTVRHEYGVLPSRTQLLDVIQQGHFCVHVVTRCLFIRISTTPSFFLHIYEYNLSSTSRQIRHGSGTCAMQYAAVAVFSELVPLVHDVVCLQLECCGADGPRDWQHSAWARAQGGAAGGAGGAADVLDLSVGAPTSYYWVPPSCCVPSDDPEACGAARRVAGASAGGGGLHGAACGPRVLAALARLARAPLALGAALLALHAAALPLAAALWLRAHPRPAYKA
uniref:SFRICE_034173 n=1 Tax=Spodoptera frugiperda TaxID=7108 RepID=A0A2H1WU41_SPOFR